MAPNYDKKVSDYKKKVPESEMVSESDNKYLKKVKKITTKMRTIVRFIQIILIIKPHLKNSKK